MRPAPARTTRLEKNQDVRRTTIMAALPLAFLAISAFLLLIYVSKLKYSRFLLIRCEIIHVLVFILCSYFYIRWLLSRLMPRIRGFNLMCCDLSQHLKFSPPEFIDKGFSDLTKYEQYWKMKHKIFSYCATQGYRPYMEDRMHYMYDPNNNLSIFGIFDGHGGLYVSDFLESNFAKSIRERLLRFGTRRKLSIDGLLNVKDPVEEMLVTEVHRLDDVLSRIDPNCTSLTGSTMIAAIMENNRHLSVINVGDSRAVACDLQNRVVPLSKDHKPDDVSAFCPILDYSSTFFYQFHSLHNNGKKNTHNGKFRGRRRSTIITKIFMQTIRKLSCMK
ncbi:unnamed protein product [Angiostrongylus costaricensis]|uniref:PPM-type phosphatase domain-containing protein n=1 Tax=Angiostrongylus costaricensis TaxID=334426 RepID=A0A0R3PNZ9_ANGCS|nr:unnamed protein product [Angiostrongylus costaricensis]